MYNIQGKYGKLTRIICFAFALHIFNLSVDSHDREPAFAKEDLSVNDIESFSEFLVEIVFGITGVFAEHDESDDNNGIPMDFSNVFFSHQDAGHLVAVRFPTTSIRYFVYNTGDLLVLAREINSPPPKA